MTCDSSTSPTKHRSCSIWFRNKRWWRVFYRRFCKICGRLAFLFEIFQMNCLDLLSALIGSKKESNDTLSSSNQPIHALKVCICTSLPHCACNEAARPCHVYDFKCSKNTSHLWGPLLFPACSSSCTFPSRLFTATSCQKNMSCATEHLIQWCFLLPGSDTLLLGFFPALSDA